MEMPKEEKEGEGRGGCEEEREARENEVQKG